MRLAQDRGDWYQQRNSYQQRAGNDDDENFSDIETDI